MDHKDKTYYESVLNYLCIGGHIDGIRFGSIPQLLISNSEENSTTIRGQIYLNLASKWCVYKTRPLFYPETERDITSMTEDEEILELCKLRLKTISNISLSDNKPNLIIELDDESIFYMNGYDDQFESWQLGVAFNTPEEYWDVIALPGGEITAFIPEQFMKNFER
ncbi:hypothetical protein E0485_05595 [Paenibacillus albiflavus]|uniref:Uncharacterized protein n=1 Tax=Paenibacillus albiflavus TaxID=2545760 RepID=A0A4R4EGV7_9BACL|nr:hypothetical protein [Paenibacillus albiflavus]TCZ79334.1 hypothetical protein E0485_05595 [Paenibacillus albiflavus]